MPYSSHQAPFFLFCYFLTISGASDREPPGAEGARGQGSAGGDGADEEGEPGIKGQTCSSAAPKTISEPAR